MQLSRQISRIMRMKINQAMEIDPMRKLADRHTNTVMVGIPHVLEGRGKTEQVCRDKECIKVSALLKMKTTVFEMTHTHCM